MTRVLLLNAGGFSAPRLYELLLPLSSEVLVVDEAVGVEAALKAVDRSNCLVISGRSKPSKAVDKLATALYKRAARAGKPVVGVCYGAQVTNLARGGSLVLNKNALRGFNEVELEPGEPVFSSLPLRRVRLYESRARSIRRLGEGLRPIAWSERGGVEAFKGLDEPPVYGYMFHPELSGGAGVEIMRSTFRTLGLV